VNVSKRYVRFSKRKKEVCSSVSGPMQKEAKKEKPQKMKKKKEKKKEKAAHKGSKT
jgi:hypothetical protein